MRKKWTPIYKVGDVVRVRKDLDTSVLYRNKSGEVGNWVPLHDMVDAGGKLLKITKINPVYECYNLEGFAKLMWTEEMLEPTNDNWKIVIMPDGDVTEARLYENGELSKVVIAKKHPDDKYDKFEASKVLIERLFDKEAPKPKKSERIVEQKVYQVGDKVKIVKAWKPFSAQNREGLMDKYLNTVMTVDKVLPFMGQPIYFMKEDNGRYAWTDLTIVGKVM